MKKILSIVLAYFCLSTVSWGAIDALNFQNMQQEDAYHRLTQELRCPQCQNNNIADSNALIAQDMRGKVFTLLQQGKSEKEIIHYMVERYGNFVTYNPPIEPSTIILWVVPFGILIFALFFLWRPRFLFNKPNDTLNDVSENKAEMNDTLQTYKTELSQDDEQRLQELLNKKDN
ncbi:hypothetical protein A6A19_07055 [Actinobacillus delphinicola]|nr:hypothetical protein [Actinobacillus delphinicola]